MPPPGGAKKKKKGRAPKHQNSFAFRHNPKSKKTDKILSSPNVGVCKRCHDKIEWRKKYRKVSVPFCARTGVFGANNTLPPLMLVTVVVSYKSVFSSINRARNSESATYVCRRTSRSRITRYAPGDRAIRAMEEKRSGSSLTSTAAKESVSVRAECNAESSTTEGGCRDPSIGEDVTAGGAPPENDNQRRRRKFPPSKKSVDGVKSAFAKCAPPSRRYRSTRPLTPTTRI